MGAKKVNAAGTKHSRRNFTNHLLKDVEALEIMLKENMIETGVKCIGAEQELAIIDSSASPVPLAMPFLDKINDKNFTTELAQFNVEANLNPYVFEGNCLSKMRAELLHYIEKAEKILAEMNARPIMVGILPTIRHNDLKLENLTPLPRYNALAEVLNSMGKGVFRYRLLGIDELVGEHNSMMMESCNTSFQLHLQVDPDEFVSLYNWTQAITAPTLAAATNSPMLLGKRVWRETRIPLFQQSIDTRTHFDMLRSKTARVTFGNDWIKNSILDIFQEDIARFSMLLNSEIKEDSLEILKSGKIPNLEALKVHNGSIYRWNRPCYGISGNGKPHIRIENRILPSGPTIDDEMANAAFWFGLMTGMPEKYRNISEIMDFDDAQGNFTQAARSGLQTQFKWVDGKIISSQKLILNELIPIAKSGLKKFNINHQDIQKYLEIIVKRVETGKTGSQWILDSYAKLKKEGTKEEALIATTSAIFERQRIGKPVHDWELAKIEEAGNWQNSFKIVGQVMTTDLFTVQESDLIELVKKVMQWKNISYVPVEDEKDRLVGLITSKILERYQKTINQNSKPKLTIKHIMKSDAITVEPEMSSLEAMELMRKEKVGSLMVVKNNKLVGIVTQEDFKKISEKMSK